MLRFHNTLKAKTYPFWRLMMSELLCAIVKTQERMLRGYQLKAPEHKSIIVLVCYRLS